MYPARQFNHVVVAVLAGSATLLMGEQSHAGLLPDLSGNHRAVAESIGTLDASFSFAVFQQGGTSGDVFGTGLDGFDSSFAAADGFPSQLDTSAEYLYLYQYVNDGLGTTAFDQLVLPTRSITSLGTWNWGFQDADGPVDVGNPFGPNGASFEPAAATNLGVVGGRVANTLSVVDKVPSLSLSGGAVIAEFNLEHLEATTVFGFTSNAPPVIQHVTLENCLNDFACGGFVTPLNADFDGDGDVDEDDLTEWTADYGMSGSDADGDNDTDGADFLAWQRQFSGNSGQLAAAIAVPEPSTVGIAMISVCGLIATRRPLGILGELSEVWR